MRRSLFTLITILVIGVLTQGCQVNLEAEEDCNFVTNSKSRRVSWSRFPIPLYVDSSMSDEGLRAIEEAAEIWNKQFNVQVFNVAGRTSSMGTLASNSEPPRDGYNGIYLVDDGKGFAEKEQARTTLHNRGDFIQEADIIINGTLSFYLGETDIERANRKVEMVSLMIHELGHVLGLDHIDDEPSVMQSRLEYGEARRKIQSAELDSLTCEY